MLRKMKLSTKLSCSFGIVLILFVGIIAIYQYTIMFTTTGFEHLLQTEVALADHAATVKALMLQCRKNEKDFLLRKDKKYTETYKKNVTALIRETQTIVQLAEQSGFNEDAGKAAAIITSAREYAQNFEMLVTAWETRGLDQNSGLQGTFRNIVHDLEETLEKHAIDDLYIALL